MTEGKVDQTEFVYDTEVLIDEIVHMFECCIWTKFIGLDYFKKIHTSTETPLTLLECAQNSIKKYINQDSNLKVEIVARYRKRSPRLRVNLRHLLLLSPKFQKVFRTRSLPRIYVCNSVCHVWKIPRRLSGLAGLVQYVLEGKLERFEPKYRPLVEPLFKFLKIPLMFTPYTFRYIFEI